MRWFTWIPAQTGKSGLFRLVRQAQKLYKLEVATSQKSYKRFVIDFINSRQFHDDKDAWSRNEHQKNYKTVSDLLMNHEKMVRRYFDVKVFNEETISMLMVEFYSSDLPKKNSKSSPKVIIRKTKCFDFWERNVLFPKTKRSFFRTPTPSTLPFSA